MKKSIILGMLVFLFPFFSHASFDVNLKYGMKNDDVQDLQELLISENCLSTSPTGYFGLLTLNGVKCFQNKYSISPVSGYFGALSRAKANTLIENITADSNKAESDETGSNTPATCTQGAKFDTQTGKPCQPDNAALFNEITQLKTQVNNLATGGSNTSVTQTNIPVTFSFVENICRHPENAIASSTAWTYQTTGDYEYGEFRVITAKKLDGTPSNVEGGAGFGPTAQDNMYISSFPGIYDYTVKLYTNIHHGVWGLPTDGATMVYSTSGTITFKDCK